MSKKSENVQSYPPPSETRSTSPPPSFAEGDPTRSENIQSHPWIPSDFLFGHGAASPIFVKTHGPYTNFRMSYKVATMCPPRVTTADIVSRHRCRSPEPTLPMTRRLD
ncbi:hypothetical protein DY000_02022466 [Brassica cretica]|uniref:Uncharacterized protein n=1 Tax=Brassica cretica TaxID=69181 RepID=A0ABQ7EBI9_BRACR|nr:hypothetical protein DY000_02022466 [Brassica cretica]